MLTATPTARSLTATCPTSRSSTPTSSRKLRSATTDRYEIWLRFHGDPETPGNGSGRFILSWQGSAVAMVIMKPVWRLTTEELISAASFLPPMTSPTSFLPSLEPPSPHLFFLIYYIHHISVLLNVSFIFRAIMYCFHHEWTSFTTVLLDRCFLK